MAAGFMLLVLAAGAWGIHSIVTDAQEVRRTAELRGAYADLRDAAAMELAAISDSKGHVARSRVLFFDAAQRATAALTRLQANASRDDRARVQRLTALAADGVERAARVYSVLASRDDSKARASRRTLETTLRATRLAAARGGSALRLRDVGRWPESRVDLLALAAMCLVFAFGVGVAARILIGLVGLSRRQADAHSAELARLELEALTDHLTGLRNHRAFQEDLKREVERRNRSGSGFALLMVDMDGLKRINDTFGHQSGDERIKAVAKCLRESLRGSDVAYRVGGDEFMVLLPAERAWGALTYAQRLQMNAATADVSVTVGITESVATESRDALIKQADLALYEAKRTHRKIVVYNPGLEPMNASDDADTSRHQHRLLATALARAVDAKDMGTRTHCETVAELCSVIGRHLGLDSENIARLRLAGLLHDVGKIGIADAILQKPDVLGHEERVIMDTHTTIGHNIVTATDLQEEADWILHHHERWDGQGSPDGLRGEEIPLESRIILVADAFEAMTADRPYRRGRSPEEALEELVAHAGAQFDPACVAALCHTFRYTPSVPFRVEDELAARRRARRKAHVAVDQGGFESAPLGPEFPAKQPLDLPLK
jgi:diguanylate cyclase (GGDEF)-like protein/putative nucleotidyltransferase with HDIG domain